MRPCQVELRTIVSPNTLNGQCDWKTIRTSCVPSSRSCSVCADPGAVPPNDRDHPFGFVRVSRNPTAAPVSRVDRALTLP